MTMHGEPLSHDGHQPSRAVSSLTVSFKERLAGWNDRKSVEQIVGCNDRFERIRGRGGLIYEPAHGWQSCFNYRPACTRYGTVDCAYMQSHREYSLGLICIMDRTCSYGRHHQLYMAGAR